MRGNTAAKTASRPTKGEEWFTGLYHDNYRILLAYARRRVDTQTADEVVADTFLVAWRRREAVPESAERAWLFGVARNTIRTAQRSGRRRDALNGKVRGAFEPPWKGNQTEASGRADALLPALRSLRESDCEILMLAAWEGLSNPEIAGVLGVSTNAVAIRIHRARKRLADRLDEIATD